MKNLKIAGVVFCAVAVLSSSFAVSAKNIATKSEPRFHNMWRNNHQMKMPKNLVVGKITSIDATNVEIEVATLSEIARKDNFKKMPRKGTKEMHKFKDKKREQPPKENQELKNEEKKAEKKSEIKEHPTMDDFFISTGETKKVNIEKCDFGKVIDFKDFKPEEKENQNREEMLKNMKDKTFSDYKVGDYVFIECTDDTYETAKSIRSNAMMPREKEEQNEEDKQSE